MPDYKYYMQLNKYQPIKFYSKAEIVIYASKKPKEFFLLPSKNDLLLERWLDKVFPKTFVDEIEEIKSNTENYKHINENLTEMEVE